MDADPQTIHMSELLLLSAVFAIWFGPVTAAPPWDTQPNKISELANSYWIMRSRYK